MTASLMQLYQTEWCPYCHRVRMKLTELGMTYITVNVPHEQAMREELFRVSGQRGIPTLVDGEVIVPDDDEAIIAYLEERQGVRSAAGAQGVPGFG